MIDTDFDNIDQSNFGSGVATIYVVATPIGNLEDISERALKVLRSVDLILSEDTRVTKKLLSHFDISGKKLISYEDYTSESKTDKILDSIKDQNLSVALVSDAGTPCVSDPGYKLIDKARSLSINVVPIPGACAAISLVSVSGLPSDRFTFVGFLPQKKSSREKEFELWSSSGGSFIFYESPKRIIKTLEELSVKFPSSIICLGKELTKFYETITRASIEEVIDKLKQNESSIKGEFCVMIYIEPQPISYNLEEIIEECRARLKNESVSDILSSFSSCKTLPRKKLYKILLDIKDNKI